MKDVRVFWLFEKDPGTETEEGIYIENKRPVRLILEYELKYNGTTQWADSALLEEGKRTLLCYLRRMDLNHAPTLYCKIWTDRTTGREYIGKFRTPLKQKLLRKPPYYDEHRGGKVYDLQWFKMKEEDLSQLEEHTKRLSRDEAEGERTFQKLQWTDPVARSQFEDQIDLHAEHMLDELERFSKEEILDIQMKAFRKYLEQALSLGKDRVFIIHGLGKGTLRNRIHRELSQHPFVRSYSDDYHPDYGHGATEVVFQ